MIGRMVLFGASGDLTSRLLMPAVAQLAEAGLLPPGFTVLGSANTDWPAEDFRQHIASELEKHAPVAPATRDGFGGHSVACCGRPYGRIGPAVGPVSEQPQIDGPVNGL